MKSKNKNEILNNELTEDELVLVTGGTESTPNNDSEEESSTNNSTTNYSPTSNTQNNPQSAPHCSPGSYEPYINTNQPYGPNYNRQRHRHHNDCYLTTACLKHFSEDFDDNCHELTVLRWFRDNYVKKEDIELYYQIAPTVVERINMLPCSERDSIYKDIYTEIISVCVNLIENKQFDKAYKLYMNSTLELSRRFITSE